MEGQGSLQHLAVNVQVDPKLAAGRGEEFSADAQIAKKRQEWEALLEDEDSFRIPIGSRVEDSLDTSGLQTASLHDSIPQWNKGFQMLQKMGWKGRGLGRSEDGITEPVRGGVEAGLRIGLGKQQQDDFYTAADNVSRRQLEVELQACEPEERTRRREAVGLCSAVSRRTVAPVCALLHRIRWPATRPSRRMCTPSGATCTARLVTSSTALRQSLRRTSAPTTITTRSG